MNSAPTTPNPRANLTHSKTFFTHAAFTLPELLVIIAVVLVVAVILLGLPAAKAKSLRIQCINNLAHVGLAHRIFAIDNGDLYPWQTNSQKFRALSPEEQILFAYRSLSNEFSTPKILTCTADIRKPATNWIDLTTNNLSYFLGSDANETYPQSIFAGDRNLTFNGAPVSGRLTITAKDQLAWDKTMHKFQGNAVMGDGSVQQLSNARLRLTSKTTGLPTNTFLIP